MHEVVPWESKFSRNGRYEMNVERRIAAGNRVNDTLAALMRLQIVSAAARLGAHNAVLILVLLYGSEMWVLQEVNENR